MSKNSRCIFVGNIPYDATEEQLKEIFSDVGPVVNFRLVFDRETGKPKGFGFCEYHDAATAQSAMRHLNNYDFGGRTLRVDFADNEKGTGPPGGPTPGGNGNYGPQGESGGSGSLGGPMGPGMDRGMSMGMGPMVMDTPTAPAMGASAFGAPVSSQNAPEAISNVVTGMPDTKIAEILHHTRAYIKAYPDQARYLLLENPQLAFALLHCYTRFERVDDETMTNLMSNMSEPNQDPMTDLPMALSLMKPIHTPVMNNIPMQMPGPNFSGGSNLQPPPQLGPMGPMGPMGQPAFPPRPPSRQQSGSPIGGPPPSNQQNQPRHSGMRPSPGPQQFPSQPQVQTQSHHSPRMSANPLGSQSMIPNAMGPQGGSNLAPPPMNNMQRPPMQNFNSPMMPMQGMPPPGIMSPYPPGMPPPPMMSQPPPVSTDAASLEEQQMKELLLKVMSLTQDEIDSLPPEQRESMLLL
eukprot:Ihof_evm45s1 gene=Ihof_evmTU45s1